MTRPPWRDFQRALEDAGFRPSKTLGQNFLLDPNMARSLVRDAGVGPGDVVVEIGAGCGFLTVELAEAGCDVRAIEVDRRLFAIAASFLAPYAGVRLVRGDALAGKHALGPELAGLLPEAGEHRVVSNLPYAIAGPLLALLARRANPPASMSLLVQREVAEKAAAAPGTSAWGALPARLDLVFERRAGRKVPAGLFWPRPRVESRVVHLTRRPGERPSAARLARFDRVVDTLFQQRRKTVLAALADALGDRGAAERALREAGVEGSARPGELSAGALLALADACFGAEGRS
jgi:16S rRNA (adenine1518-N6/adenine1519-N6)-dimethyltransferase